MINLYKLAMYVARIYDMGECSIEHNDDLVKFMKWSGKKWPQVHDSCWVPPSRIIIVVHLLKVCGHGACSYSLADVEFCNTVNFWEDSEKQNKINF